jgi:hypothetical protein
MCIKGMTRLIEGTLALTLHKSKPFFMLELYTLTLKAANQRCVIIVCSFHLNIDALLILAGNTPTTIRTSMLQVTGLVLYYDIVSATDDSTTFNETGSHH